jgi:hypothetical protein
MAEAGIASARKESKEDDEERANRTPMTCITGVPSGASSRQHPAHFMESVNPGLFPESRKNLREKIWGRGEREGKPKLKRQETRKPLTDSESLPLANSHSMKRYFRSELEIKPLRY